MRCRMLACALAWPPPQSAALRLLPSGLAATARPPTKGPQAALPASAPARLLPQQQRALGHQAAGPRQRRAAVIRGGSRRCQLSRRAARGADHPGSASAAPSWVIARCCRAAAAGPAAGAGAQAAGCGAGLAKGWGRGCRWLHQRGAQQLPGPAPAASPCERPRPEVDAPRSATRPNPGRCRDSHAWRCRGTEGLPTTGPGRLLAHVAFQGAQQQRTRR